MISTFTAVRHLPGLRRRLALMLALIALAVAPSLARAQDEQRAEAQIGPFTATGEWAVEGTSVKGKGEIKAPWGGTIGLTATYDTEGQTGKWTAKFSHPVLGPIGVASGGITERALEFDQKVTLGAGTAVFHFQLTPEHLTGTSDATLKAGKVALGKVGLKFADEIITADAAAQARLPGISTPVGMSLVFEGVRFAGATGTAKIVLGPYAFAAEAHLDARGKATATAVETQSLPGIGETELTLAYNDGRLSATGTRTLRLGNIAFDNTTIALDKVGKISLSKTASVDLPGIGSTQLALSYANNKLSASGTRQVKLGSYAFDNTAITVDSAGTITLAKRASLNLPVVGATQMDLAYANGVLSASGSRTVSLGSFSFSSTAISLDSAGGLTITKQQAVSIPGIGSTQMTLAFADGVLSATGTRSVSLGNYAFDSTAIGIDSTGTVSVSAVRSLSLPGLSATQMTLGYAGGKLSATATRTVTLGSFSFDNATIVIDSTGGIAATKQQAIDIPGIGSTQMTVVFVNGAFVATGTRTVELGDFAFDDTAISIESSGAVTASNRASLTLPVIGATQMDLHYANGIATASGSRTVSLGSFAFSNAAITIGTDGTLAISKVQNLNLPVIGSTQMELAYANGVLSASGSRDVSLGSFLFSSASIALSSNGTLSINKTQSLNLPVIGSAQMELAYANGVLSASGSRDVSLGRFLFSSAAIALSSNGTLSINKTQSLDLPGLGATQMALAYADGQLSASGSRTVNLGNYAFSDAAISLSSSGTISVSKTQSVTIPGIGGVSLALGYANGQVSATGTASITVSVLSRSLNFGSAAVQVSSSGGVTVTASQGINIGPLHYNVSITYENGSIKVHY